MALLCLFKHWYCNHSSLAFWLLLIKASLKMTHTVCQVTPHFKYEHTINNYLCCVSLGLEQLTHNCINLFVELFNCLLLYCIVVTVKLGNIYHVMSCTITGRKGISWSFNTKISLYCTLFQFFLVLLVNKMRTLVFPAWFYSWPQMGITFANNCKSFRHGTASHKTSWIS